MAQCSSTLAALAQDLSLISTNHMAAHDHVANGGFCYLWQPSTARVNRKACCSALQGYIKQPTISLEILKLKIKRTFFCK